jgi:mono/diheme cytochrome c family protein
VILDYTTRIKGALLRIAFFISACVTAGLLVACDNGGSSGAVAAGGERVYMDYCNSCHPGGGRGAGPALIPLLPGLSDDRIRDIVRHAKAPMPRYNENAIPEDQLTSLIVYMRAMK